MRSTDASAPSRRCSPAEGVSDQYGVKDAACPISTKEGGGGGARSGRVAHAPWRRRNPPPSPPFPLLITLPYRPAPAT